MFLPGTVTGGTMKRLLVLLGSGAIAFGIACSGNPSGSGNGCESTGASVTISAQDNQTFSPPSPVVNVGQSVCWQNFGTLSHTVTANANAQDTTWKLDGQLNPDLIVLYTFGKQGINYTYHCRIHPGMTGTIQVR